MRTLLKFLALPTILAALALPARATITLTFQAENIVVGGSGSNNVSAGSLVLVVADTTGSGFASLTSGCITTGSAFGSSNHDLIVAQLAISPPNQFTGTENSLDSTAIYTPSGAWATNDPLAIYWIPSLNLGATNVGLNVAYGSYTDATGLDGSAPWFTPGPGGFITMLFSTSDDYGDSSAIPPASVGFSSFNTIAVPEPSTFGLLSGASVLGLAFFRRRKTSSTLPARA